MTCKSHLLWAVSASWPWRWRLGFRLFANGGFAEAALNVVASSAAFYAWWHLH